VMYIDICGMTTLEILLSIEEMLWYYSAAMFRKIIYACFGLIEEVASKSFVW